MKETLKSEPNTYRNLVIIKMVSQITTTKVNFRKKEKERGRKEERKMMEQLFSHLEKDKTRSLQQIIYTNPKRSEIKK